MLTQETVLRHAEMLEYAVLRTSHRQRCWVVRLQTSHRHDVTRGLQASERSKQTQKEEKTRLNGYQRRGQGHWVKAVKRHKESTVIGEGRFTLAIPMTKTAVHLEVVKSKS